MGLSCRSLTQGRPHSNMFYCRNISIFGNMKTSCFCGEAPYCRTFTDPFTAALKNCRGENNSSTSSVSADQNVNAATSITCELQQPIWWIVFICNLYSRTNHTGISHSLTFPLTGETVAHSTYTFSIYAWENFHLWRLLRVILGNQWLEVGVAEAGGWQSQRLNCSASSWAKSQNETHQRMMISNSYRFLKWTFYFLR